MKCTFLDGENIKPTTTKEAKLLIGKHVIYLQRQNVDKSGRGYFFPQDGIIMAVEGKNIAINHPENFNVYISDILEMILA